VCYILPQPQTSFCFDSSESEFVVDSKPAPQNIQDAFLNLARRERSTVTIYLVNGAKLLGRIKSFDKFSVMLEAASQEQLIFKHAISTISHTRRSSGELRSLSDDAGASQTTPPTDDSKSS
jgi:host factor-I protein